MTLKNLVNEIANCDTCLGKIPAPNPIISVHGSAKILLVGQAPGSAVHETKIPWNDPSGRRLRNWLGISEADFYNPEKLALVPMGFCYPGKGKSGDLPPRTECAPKWHADLLKQMPDVQCTLLIGNYAQRYYLTSSYQTLTERVKNWREFAPTDYVLPHPSPRNQSWLKENQWFENDVLPNLRKRIDSLLLKT